MSLINLWLGGPKDQGVVWYANARLSLDQISTDLQIPRETVCAVCAILSPQIEWTKNLEITRSLFECGSKRQAERLAGYNVNKAKAWDLWQYGAWENLRGPKVTAFFDNLLDPASKRVTIDRWMLRAAGSIPNAQSRYLRDAIIAEIVDIAQIEGLYPYQVQATIWLAMKQ